MGDVSIERWKKWIDFKTVPPQTALVIPFAERLDDPHWDERTDQLMLYTSTQVPHIIRVGIAQFLGLDQGGMNAIDPHAVLLAEVGQALGEGGNRGIDRTADGETLLRLASTCAGDRHQRPVALLQQRPGRAREPHMREEFESIAVCPIGVGQFEKVATLGRAGIVDEDVEAVELALDRSD